MLILVIRIVFVFRGVVMELYWVRLCVCGWVCFQILEEVERRREICPALVSPFMRSVMEAPFPAPGRTITVKSFLPGSGNEVTITTKRKSPYDYTKIVTTGC